MTAIQEPALLYKMIKFEDEIASYRDLTTFRPKLPGPDWFYLGPVATSDSVKDRLGMIVKAVDPTALEDVTSWEKVGPNNDPEPTPFSTWRGQAPKGYVVVGDFFVTGNEKPTAEQTAGIKAVRSDLVDQVEPHRLIWEGRLPWSVVTLWDVIAVALIYIPTGAFVSTPKQSADGAKLALFYWNNLAVCHRQ